VLGRFLTFVVAAVLLVGAALLPVSVDPSGPSDVSSSLAQSTADADDVCPEVALPPPPVAVVTPRARRTTPVPPSQGIGRPHAVLVFRPPRLLASR
jgi:hypothetical protein